MVKGNGHFYPFYSFASSFILLYIYIYVMVSLIGIMFVCLIMGEFEGERRLGIRLGVSE